MSRSRYAVLPLVLGLLAGTACNLDYLSGVEFCLHSEGCDGGGGGFGFSSKLDFYGRVTSAVTGRSLASVTVLVEAPARVWSTTVLTDSTGWYQTNELPNRKLDDCVGLSVTFSAEGYQPLRLTDFLTITCGPGLGEVNARLTPVS